jgi:mannose-6-phosphate isomerase
LRRLFIGSMRAPPEQRAKLVQTTADACARALARADVTDAADRASLRWLVELAGRYPSDAGVLAPLLLNYVALEPGEALYLGAGSPHAYLHGVGIEIMASSDNVLRGGLTEKHVDIDELERVVRFESSTVTKLQPRVTAAGEAVYRTPAPEFRLSRLELDDHSFSTAVLGPEILLCWQGKLRVQSGSVELDLERGTSAFVPAHSARYSVEGSGTLFRASVGSVSDDQARA